MHCISVSSAVLHNKTCNTFYIWFNWLAAFDFNNRSKPYHKFGFISINCAAHVVWPFISIHLSSMLKFELLTSDDLFSLSANAALPLYSFNISNHKSRQVFIFSVWIPGWRFVLFIVVSLPDNSSVFLYRLHADSLGGQSTWPYISLLICSAGDVRVCQRLLSWISFTFCVHA